MQKVCNLYIFDLFGMYECFFFTRQQVSLMLESLSYFSWFQCGSFLKWGYPQIIHFARIFHSKPTIWGTPICGNLRGFRIGRVLNYDFPFPKDPDNPHDLYAVQVDAIKGVGAPPV